MNPLKSFKNLTGFETGLWLTSVFCVTISYFFGSRENILSFIASLIGVTALIFIAKGDVLGQLLTIIFSIFYGLISYGFHYYGEMITYLCMTAPMALLAVVSWHRHPYAGKKTEVAVSCLKKSEIVFMFALAAVVTALFYFILNAFHTRNLMFSTISITTSFLASYLTFRRSAFYALAYAANDLILIVLWILASIEDRGYISMVICFGVFFANDMYGFISWSRMKRRQEEEKLCRFL